MFNICFMNRLTANIKYKWLNDLEIIKEHNEDPIDSTEESR